MRHKILVLFALLLAFSIYGCSKPDDIFHNYEGTYPEDIVSEDNCMPSFGRIYIDPAYYRAIDGKDYIAVNTFQGAFVKEDVMNSLSVGDDLRIDRDTTVKVDRLDFDPDWEDPYYPEGGNFTNGVMFHRKKGIITINKDFFSLIRWQGTLRMVLSRESMKQKRMTGSCARFPDMPGMWRVPRRVMFTIPASGSESAKNVKLYSLRMRVILSRKV